MWSTLTRITSAWGLGDPLPLTTDRIFAVGATLKGGDYRSRTSDFSRLLSAGERHNAIEHPMAVSRALKDAERACARGRGALDNASGSL